ncbi:hypothetical protein D3C72_569630 [compost metagenome]
MNDQHARVPGGGVPQCGVRGTQAMRIKPQALPCLQNPALARRAHLDTVFDHAGDACLVLARHAEDGAQRLHFAIGGGDDEWTRRIRRHPRIDRASPQAHPTHARAEVQVHGRTRVQRQLTAIRQGIGTAFAGARAQVGGQRAQGNLAVNQRRHAARGQRHAQRIAQRPAPGRRGQQGRASGLALLNVGQRGKGVLDGGVDGFPGRLVPGVGLFPLFETRPVCGGHATGRQQHHPVHGRLQVGGQHRHGGRHADKRAVTHSVMACFI